MRNVTLLAAVCGLLALAPVADAQGCDASDPEQAGFTAVDIRDINAVPQANIDQLNAAVGDGSITIADMQSLLTNDLEGSVVEFDAVVLSDPILSAIRSSVGGIPGGIHFYVRDMSAAAGDRAGRGVQVVDNRGGGEAQALRVGSVITVCARIAPFTGSGGKAMQVGGNSGIFSITQTDILDPTDPANAALFAPVMVTTDDVHDTLPGGETILNFDNYADYNGQYVRFEGISVVQGVQGDRPNVLLQSPTQDTQINLYDTSACFRNDRDASYFPPDRAPACIDDDFVPPATGTANLQGFLVFQGDDGGFNYSEPGSANFVVNPFEEADFEITAAPPTIAVGGPASIPGPTDNVTITATIVPAQGTIASAEIAYAYYKDGVETQSGTAAMSNTGGDEWAGEIPARANDDANGSFVAYNIFSTDSGGLSSESEDASYLVFEGAINAISLIQQTFDGGSGDSPLITGDPAVFDLTATVMSVIQDGSVYLATIQDTDEEFGGVWMFLGSDDQGLAVGDQINITEATVEERFDLTRLVDLTFTTLGTVTPFDPVVLSTDEIAGGEFAEAAEGVLIRFENVTITSTNADDPSGPFGEFNVSNGSAADAVRVDDLSDGDNGINFPDNDPGAVYSVDDVLSFVQGPMYYSFGNYKLAPRTPSDIGDVVVAIEDEPGLGAARIERVFPNPSAGTARVQFALDVAGEASVWLFDVTGRQVATLAAGPMAAGPHAVDLDVSGLAAGVYVLRLEAEGGVDTARISVVR